MSIATKTGSVSANGDSFIPSLIGFDWLRLQLFFPGENYFKNVEKPRRIYCLNTPKWTLNVITRNFLVVWELNSQFYWTISFLLQPPPHLKDCSDSANSSKLMGCIGFSIIVQQVSIQVGCEPPTILSGGGGVVYLPHSTVGRQNPLWTEWQPQMKTISGPILRTRPVIRKKLQSVSRFFIMQQKSLPL